MMSQTKKQLRLAMPLAVIAALVLLLSGSGMAQTATQDLTQADKLYHQGQFDDAMSRKIAAIATAQSDLEMFSGTVLVARNGKVLYTGAFGKANKDNRVPNKLETRFNIGSIGKTFTAVAVMQLVQNGKLQLADNLGKFYPECPFAEKKTITVYHLLTHTSGLGNYFEHREFMARMDTLRTVSDTLPLIFSQKPAFAAGERFQYSNSGMFLLGGIIEKVSGLPYSEYIRQYIFVPCDMMASGIVQEEEILPDRAIGYSQNADGSFTANILVVPPAFSDGGLRTTVGDMLKFDQALVGEALLSALSKQIMFASSSQKPTYACGWETKEFFGQRYVGHSGGTDGVEAFFYRFIDSGYTVIVLSNYHNGAEELTTSIMALLFGKPYSLPTAIDANFRLGYRLQGEKKLQDAAKILARNLATDPPHLLSLFFAANVRIRGGFEVETALNYLDRYLRLAGTDSFPPASIVWQQKGNAFEKLGRRKEAIRAFERSLALDPQNQAAREKLKKLREATSGPTKKKGS